MQDLDPNETQEWFDAIDSVIREEGVERAQFLVEQVTERARANGVAVASEVITRYTNTIPVNEQPECPAIGHWSAVFEQ